MSGENATNNGDSQSQKGAEDRKIFVGGIGAEVTNEDLQQHFSQFGEVSQAQVKIDRATGRSRGFAFVEFGTSDACRKALDEREQIIKGKTCEIKPAKSRENKKVFVGGIPADHPEEELRKYFEQFGKVDDVEWPFDKQTKTRRNFAFIVFEEEEATERAVAQPKHTFSDRECDVKKAVPQSRRFNNFRGQMGGGPRGYGAGMPRQMPMHNAAPWYNGWNQMSNMYGGQSGQHSSGGWGEWNPSSYGYFQGGQQGNYGYGKSSAAGSYDYSQNGVNSNRGGQSQNGSVSQRQAYQSQY